MSDKPWNTLNELDRLIRQAARCGMTDGTVMAIEFISGFEKFNTREYHNHETWAQGYRISGLGVSIEREDLDDAVSEWARLVTLKRAGDKSTPAWRYGRCPTQLDVRLLDDWIASSPTGEEK